MWNMKDAFLHFFQKLTKIVVVEWQGTLDKHQPIDRRSKARRWWKREYAFNLRGEMTRERERETRKQEDVIPRVMHTESHHTTKHPLFDRRISRPRHQSSLSRCDRKGDLYLNHFWTSCQSEGEREREISVCQKDWTVLVTVMRWTTARFQKTTFHLQWCHTEIRDPNVHFIVQEKILRPRARGCYRFSEELQSAHLRSRWLGKRKRHEHRSSKTIISRKPTKSYGCGKNPARR